MFPPQDPTTNHRLDLHPQRREDCSWSLCFSVPCDCYDSGDDDDDAGDDSIVTGNRRLGFDWEDTEDMDLLVGHIVDFAKLVGLKLADEHC